MGHKLVCLACQKAFGRDSDFDVAKHQSIICPECGETGVLYSHRFRPPSKLNNAKWQVVKFLFEHGFVYQHIHDGFTKGSDGKQLEKHAEYPDTMSGTRDFVQKYISQVKKRV